MTSRRSGLPRRNTSHSSLHLAMARIPSGYLPPGELWSQRVYTLPEHASYPQRLNFTEELVDRHVAEGRGEHAAILFDDQRISYKALQASVNKLGNALRSLGVEEEDRVLLRAPSIPPALVANFAVLKIGGVIVPTSPLFSRAEIVHVAAVTEAVAMIVAAPLLEEVERARGELAGVKHIVVIGGESAEIKAKGYIPYGELMAQGATGLEPVRRDRMAVSALLFTSGTTGLPKGTVHFMEEALTVPDGFGKYGWGVTPDDVIGGPAPVSLAGGHPTQGGVPLPLRRAAPPPPPVPPGGGVGQVPGPPGTLRPLPPAPHRQVRP